MVSNRTGQAAAWYITQQHEIADISALAAALRREFITPDLQERLRDSLYQLKQRECRDLHEYVTKYRQLISRVKAMGELYKTTLSTRGFVSQTRLEVAYRRRSTVHQAINAHQLLVKEGMVNGTHVKILLDSGADHNVVRKSLVTQVERRKNVSTALSPMRNGSTRDILATNDVILGKPWFSRLNPNITIERMLSNYADCFPTELPNELPVSRSVEVLLTMMADAHPSSCAPFWLSKPEPDALQLFVDELLRKKWIEVSDSPWVSSIFAVPMKDPTTGKAPLRTDWLRSGNSSLPVRWVVDYRYVNSQTEIPKFPLPRIEDLFDRMQGCPFFSTLDLAQGYHQMLVDPLSPKYTFRTDTETCQWCVAPMELAGMPGVWSQLMRLLFGSLDFVVVYLDDLCIFSRTELEHIAHCVKYCALRSCMRRLSKCRFGCTSEDFLGHNVSADGLRVGERKTRAIEEWPVPTSAKNLQSFLGLCGNYRHFIGRLAEIVLPLSNLLKKNAAWTWTD
ncbi:Retroelement pol Polyprotein [Phytophthora megakarya]|uniref:Retroelement pol Polyprotein n=1 Tax=Phytophthora megakarya TaxID=4795 RepID=A0A225VV00_9STRA|nr:Retroelement pol Polyprotein [Phytophthora megakarya]